ncbi:ATP-dependent DNA helicase [Bacillus luteolus]|uniref:ATP-dependent DNA helicase n=1 Tax=Litchfieldia luteola TaxID=682179 RepID=A0ABR9QNX9_9BACI|nr:ATP-dependent DNA helicase [Cytobacillus luteolus]MBE4910213.1 ATP-dependent DNA helicase [Cytobacillus luteolus]MBP1942217.1 ATP-dependent DNA helicase DinG [Cytobacillus luteolus]
MIRDRLPFQITKQDNFFDKLNEWIGDIFYDILPDKGFELRDEQIYMAFQLERAFKNKSIVFAEAGVGTGKTIVYLLYALCYARFTGKPAIIACADESLIEQLVKPEGDIAKISTALDLNIDVRLAKSQDQYLCLRKLDDVMVKNDSELIHDLYSELPDFVHNPSTLQSFYHYGDRKNYSDIPDEDWDLVAWDTFQDCFSCEKRHRCGQTLSREHYRKATDLIICSHDFYMEHVWTSEARKREGQLPLLPEGSCVVFDEGHLLEFAAQKALTYRVKETTLENLLTRLLENDIREEFAYLIESSIEQNERFFTLLKKSSTKVQGSDRMDIQFDSELRTVASKLYTMLSKIGDDLVFESETYTIDHYELNIVDEHLDKMEFALKLLLEKSEAIFWIENTRDGDSTLVIMPRAVEAVLKENVFSKKMPFIFSSATLSENQTFDYIASSLGVTDFDSFSVESPFNYDEQMSISAPVFKMNDNLFLDKVSYTIDQLKKTDGRALVLFNTKEELLKFKQEVSNTTSFSFLFEGEQEISQLVSRFQNNEETVLCAVHLWEGLDIPGPSLSNVIIWSLPFPPNDPVFQAKRKYVENAFWKVDVPYMILRLKQGVGRLIRAHEDKGIISIYLTDQTQSEVIEQVKQALPTEVKISNE